MVERTVSTTRYVAAGIITLLVFLLGISLGFTMDNERVKVITRENRGQELDGRSIQLQYLMLNALTNNNATCSLLQTTLEDSIKSLHNSLEKLVQYKEDTTLNDAEFAFLHRKYLLDNVQYWQFAQRARSLCGIDVVNVLYFFSTKECKTCPDQGVILTYFKKKFGDQLLIFPIDVDMEKDEHIITLLRRSYGVEELPAIVLQEKPYKGRVVPKTELLPLLCAGYAQQPQGCSEALNETS